ncbi:hypothetical protein AVEN_267161-1 [Araneus ventricosus]|uniref:Uncharacterized protein n=1 Tax=Araneus ventricosus TaxID=182803 RepID=A0A4Y2LJI1_ARAVE|nr:hypothetical protein AVEN_267161-1 [Araneus ventricosus]
MPTKGVYSGTPGWGGFGGVTTQPTPTPNPTGYQNRPLNGWAEKSNTVCPPRQLCSPSCLVTGGRYRDRYRGRNLFRVGRSSRKMYSFHRRKLSPRINSNPDFRRIPLLRNGSSLT